MQKPSYTLNVVTVWMKLEYFTGGDIITATYSVTMRWETK